jgi:hypothetical protein
MSTMYSANSVLIRQTTPPSYMHHSHSQYYPDSMDENLPAPDLYCSNNASPDSIITNDPSPGRLASASMRGAGPTLLPKIRCQDQTTEPLPMAMEYHSGPTSSHGRALSMTIPQIRTHFHYPQPFPRRATSPPEGIEMPSPISACSLPASVFSHALSASSALNDTTNGSIPARFGTSPSPLHTNLNSPITSNAEIVHSRRSSMAMGRAVSGPLMTSHKRSGSSVSNIDENILRKHGYPTQYRQIPQFITAAPSISSSPAPSVNAPVQPIDQFDVFSPVEGPTFIQEIPVLTTTIARYLTEPGPTPSLVSRSVTDQMKHRDFGWWDVRNLNQWTDFNYQNVHNVDGFSQLLNVPIDLRTLPHPSPNSIAPDTEYSLRNLFAEYFAVRVNASLRQTQGTQHLHMRANNSATTQYCPKPDFISHYDGDVLKTLRGDPRGHLVGIVKSYDDFNSSMRSQNAPAQVKYLRGLAQLHRIMREHGCRYGYIITEIELICVRAGAEDHEYYANRRHGLAPHVDEGPRPIFGRLQTSVAIPLSATGINPSTGQAQMTVGLALWYLHMLAKDDPLPGQAIWKMDVGGPAAVSRHHHYKRDAWMPRVGLQESRIVKRLRGWIYPEEPFSRKEQPNQKRRG